MSLICGVAEGFALLLAPLRNKKTPFVQIGTDHSAVPPKLCKKHLSTPLTRGDALLLAAGSGAARRVFAAESLAAWGPSSLMAGNHTVDPFKAC